MVRECSEGLLQHKLIRICNSECKRLWISNPIIKNMKTIVKVISISCIILLVTVNAHAQKKLQASGFLEYLNNTWIPSNTYSSLGFDYWQNQSTIYNRINLWYKPADNLEFHAGIRNNFTFGPLVAQYNKFIDYSDLATYDDGYLNLTWEDIKRQLQCPIYEPRQIKHEMDTGEV